MNRRLSSLLLTTKPSACAAVFSGFLVLAASALGSEVIDLKDGAPVTFYGRTASAFGWAFAFGDIDGDGYLDFLGSSASSRGPNDELDYGKDVYLFFGGPREEVDSLYSVDAPGVADIIFYRGGFTMSCADIDADGYDDIILGDYLGYVIFGGPRESLRKTYMFDDDHPDYTPPDVLLLGTHLGGRTDPVTSFAYDLVSRELATGNLNGDRYADIAIGASGTAEGHGGGVAYIIMGRPREQFPPVIDADLGSERPHADVTIYGENGEAYPTHLVIGDLDGDGMDDLVTSTIFGWGEENVDPVSAEVHGFWGRTEWDSIYDTQIETFDFAMWGHPVLYFGYRLATGDLDGDGRDELIVGSPFPSTGGRANAGSYRVFFGRPRGEWPKWSSGVEMTDVLLLGADTGDAMNGLDLLPTWGIAFSMSTGNRNGDGYDDLLIGAGHADGPEGLVGALPRYSAGEAYLLRGRPRSAWAPFIDLRDGYDVVFFGAETGVGAAAFDLLGYTTALADFDGNGLDELFMSAQFADGPDNTLAEAGEVYVFFDADTVASPPTAVRPVAYATLLSNYPNPFNPVTTLRFRAPAGVVVSLSVYDALGRTVSRPLLPTRAGGGLVEVRWEARDEGGRRLPSGVYFLKLKAGHEVHARKMHVVR